MFDTHHARMRKWRKSQTLTDTHTHALLHIDMNREHDSWMEFLCACTWPVCYMLDALQSPTHFSSHKIFVGSLAIPFYFYTLNWMNANFTISYEIGASIEVICIMYATCHLPLALMCAHPQQIIRTKRATWTTDDGSQLKIDWNAINQNWHGEMQPMFVFHQKKKKQKNRSIKWISSDSDENMNRECAQNSTFR